MSKSEAIPIIDLFAGPGGLGEGFSKYRKGGKRRFEIHLSIEKDPIAHKTLTLRAFFRQFPDGKVPEAYYDYLKGRLSREDLFSKFPSESTAARAEAQCLTLGEDPGISKLIGRKLSGVRDWVLIGGPPCQAYSLVGRSRMLGVGVQTETETSNEYSDRIQNKKEAFEKDHRHLLYREYLKIIADHRPSIFVMENVKGILSAKLDDKLIFPSILKDLKNPNEALRRKKSDLRYKIFSLVKTSENGEDYRPLDYLIRTEEYGIPQARHRVILLGIREDFYRGGVQSIKTKSSPTVRETIGDLPKLTPGLSKRADGKSVYDALARIKATNWWQEFSNSKKTSELAKEIELELFRALRDEQRGKNYQSFQVATDDWYSDCRLGGVCNHETRSHIKEDLWRYLFCSCFAIWSGGKSPQLADFPSGLLPKHKNVQEAIDGQKFGDRFRVQVADRHSTTVTSHISKDGHYFIHYDPTQYRSLTVREAARLQTFPDNYLFEGPRTQQLHQVGNAVPPLLAYQIAQVVSEIFDSVPRRML